MHIRINICHMYVQGKGKGSPHGLSKPDQPFGFLLEDTMLDTNTLH